MYVKLLEAVEKFNWDRKFVFETFFMVGDIGTYSFNQKSIYDDVDDQVDQGNCDCRYDLGCPGWGDCVKGMCEKTDSGCELFGISSCTGKC